MAEKPRVFLSYAHSDIHARVVLGLANHLRIDGVDAWIDQYEQAPPAGWRAWMEQQLRQADFVLIVASELYRMRIESSGPLEAGRGVRFESTLVLDDLYEAGMWNVKYVPVVLLEDDREHVPRVLRSYQRYSLYRRGGYERLLRHLTGQPAIEAPPVGPRRDLPPVNRGWKGLRSDSENPTRPGNSFGAVFCGSLDPGPLTEDGDAGDVDLPPEDQPNPFDPWTPAVPPRFQGRQSELRRLERALDSGFGVSIVGDGRIGKSSLLRTFQGRLAAEGRTVRFLDGQGPEGESIAAFVAKAVRKPVTRVPPDADGAANELASWVDGAGNGPRPVLLVDELDGLVSRFEIRFFERLRNLIGRLVLVVASRREVDRLYKDRGLTSPFDNRLLLVRVGLAQRADADAVIALGEGLLEAEDPATLRRWAGRHLHFVQLLAFHLLDARAHGEEDDALDRFLDESASRLRDLWDHLGEKDQEYLLALARGQELTAPRLLIRRGVLEKDGRPFGEVLGTWLREEL